MKKMKPHTALTLGVLLQFILLIAARRSATSQELLLDMEPELDKTQIITIELKKQVLSTGSQAKMFNFISRTQTLQQKPLTSSMPLRAGFHTNFKLSNEIRLTNYQNIQFVGKIAFADPLETYDAIFDTGNLISHCEKFK